MLIALHLLQNHAPSNLNRDDNNEPKDAIFGGVRRARISSQAIKRSIRWSDHFRAPFETQGLLAIRTQLLPEKVRHHLVNAGLNDDDQRAIVEAAARLGKGEQRSPSGEGEAGDERGEQNQPRSSPRSRRGSRQSNTTGDAERIKTAQLMFLTENEIQQLARRLIEIVREKGAKHLNELQGDTLVREIGEYEPHSVDIAMFGRMTTSSPFKDVEAAVQVAHAISTHAVEMEFDFYTAVDDISGEAGTGFIGDTTFNSATYKYFSIDWDGLLKNLHGEQNVARQSVEALIRAALFAIPSGKQNSFAAHNLPDLALVEVRKENVALSYANAFVKPVRATGNLSLIEASAKALEEYIPAINDRYNLSAQRAFLSTVPFTLSGAACCSNLEELITWLSKQMQIQGGVQ
ncbi:MAG: type I-E CRISPR-associated protein Cas7/Cse4/CasC [Roseiflexus sp.]|nr:type I-E CRISPR-associated protein Cas7/Cse4/CasC [Roseiflexus sp.]MBO9390920.1 type I-E CRISPR-associated protein Cas7/Cse4/CasC [Roseiflexus sp.]